MCPIRTVLVWACWLGLLLAGLPRAVFAPQRAAAAHAPPVAEAEGGVRSPGAPLTLPWEERPEWLRRDGIVMAGSWEPLLFRVRRDGSKGYTPTAEQRAAYRREQSPDMVARLKRLGVNFVMMPCYKGAGRKAERESMADAARFAKLCHDNGLHVGVYVYSGAFLWELFFKEVPEAEDWVIRDEHGEPLRYGSGRVPYRYYWNRNHPGAQAYYRRIVRFAVEEIQADLLHFDNYTVGPGYDAHSIDRFRRYLRRTFRSDQLHRMGIAEPAAARPPAADAPPLLRYAWDEFRCRSLAESYDAMSRDARTLRPDVLVECNPGGVGPWIRPPRDHGRLLQGGEAFWDESRAPALRGGKLSSHIRTYKVARAMNNMAFCYTTTPLAMAESMAFNQDCLGAVCWFEYGKVVKRPGSDAPVPEGLKPFIQFFHKRHDLLRGAHVVADAAVLRSFPSQVFADSQFARLTARTEDRLIRQRACFQIIYDHQLDELSRQTVLVLAGCVALSDRQIDRIQRFVRSGGRLCIIGPAATHDQWMKPRPESPLAKLPASHVVHLDPDGDLLRAIRQACAGRLSLEVTGPTGLCTELTDQPDRRLVHLVNYQTGRPAKNVSVRVRLPDGRQATRVILASPEHDVDAELSFTQQRDAVSFTVPSIKTYEIAVVSMGPRKSGS